MRAPRPLTRLTLLAALAASALWWPRVAGGQNRRLPQRFDWTERGIVTPAKDQGSSGTCWAFAAVGLVEALVRRETGTEVDLSEQYLVSNIDGVSPFLAMEFLQTRGVVREEHLPYRGDTSSANTNRRGEFFLAEYGVTNLSRLSPSDRVTRIKQVVHEFGPVVANMHLYDDFRRYRSGVYAYDGHSPEQAGGHIILITGWVDDRRVVNGGYWIVKNSAGRRWGEDGFGKVAYGQAGLGDYYVIHGVLRPPQRRRPG